MNFISYSNPFFEYSIKSYNYNGAFALDVKSVLN
jgi:hypothetical protein